MTSFDRILADFESALTSGTLTLFLGAGISAAPPAGLPLAAGLMDEVVRIFTGTAQTYLPSLSIRPEVLFNIVHRHAGTQLINFLTNRLSTPAFNANHAFAAACLIRGASIITTNFDRLIEQAAHTAGIEARIVLPNGKLADPLGTVYKIHGSIDSPEFLALTIDHIARGLLPIDSQRLHQLVDDRTLIVLGYSGLDQLDIMPELARCRPNVLWWVNHSTNAKPFESEPEINEILSLAALNHINVDTTYLVEDISEACALERPAPIYGHNGAPACTTLSLPNRVKTQIAYDLALHHSDFRAAASLVEDRLTGEGIEDRVAQLETLNWTGSRKGAYWDLVNSILNEIMQAPEKEQRRHAFIVAKWGYTEAHRDLTLRLLNELLQSPNTSALEAVSEFVEELFLRHRFEDANTLLSRAELAAQDSGSLLIQARLAISRAEFTYYAVVADALLPDAVPNALDKAEWAASMFDDPILNDPYYAAQAANAAGLLLQLTGEFAAAKKRHWLAFTFFEKVSINETVQSLLALSLVEEAEDNMEMAITLVERAIDLTHDNERIYRLGHLYLRRAQLLLLQEASPDRRELVQSLTTAIYFLNRGEYTVEETIAQQTLKELLTLAASSSSGSL